MSWLAKPKNMETTAPRTPLLNSLIAKAKGCHFSGKPDKGGRWFPDATIAQQYCYQQKLRRPSRDWPHSYRDGLSTIKANLALSIVTPKEATIVRAGIRLKKQWARDLNERAACAEKLMKLECELAHRTSANTESLVHAS